MNSYEGSMMQQYGQRIEAAAVGALILNPAALDRVREWLAPSDFLVPHYRVWFTSICGMRDRGTPIDQITLLSELRRANPSTLDPHQLAELATVSEQVPIPAAALSYAAAVLEESARHRLRTAGRRLLQISEGGDLAAVFANARTAMLEVERDRARCERFTAPSQTRGLSHALAASVPATARRTQARLELSPNDVVREM
ncbi:MAG: DnaB-like helicase N-terminal domain-containing protein [Mycobacteriales bacterium]